jgi:hypothetical protein
MHQIKIRHFGPIDSCTLPIDNFTILTGPQANGKSTIARSVFFFRTIKDELLKAAKQGDSWLVNPENEDGRIDSFELGRMRGKIWVDQFIKTILKPKFFYVFGPTFAMDRDMSIVYNFTDEYSVKATIVSSWDTGVEKKYLDITIYKELREQMEELTRRIPSEMTTYDFNLFKKSVNELFDDDTETVFIPAGRSLITVLTDQLNYLFVGLNPLQLRTIDFCTREFINKVLEIRPFFNPANTNSIRDENLLSDINFFRENCRKILGGEYQYIDNEERLYLSSDETQSQLYVKINYTSSGQQEMLWVLNLMYYLLTMEKRVFLIVEEPEAHLYPESQAVVADILGIFAGKESSVKNAALITTHSPYILGEMNNLIKCALRKNSDKANNVRDKRMWLDPTQTKAFHIANKEAISAQYEDNTIKSEIIDDASHLINNAADELIDLMFEEQEDDLDGETFV